MSSDRTGPNRRTVLRAAAGATGVAAAAGTASAQQERPDWGGYLDGVDGGYRDARGQDSVTVDVGAEGNGGFYAFAPAGLWVDPGTTVTWEWTGQGAQHNVVGQRGPASLDSGDPVAEAGTTYEYTFEEGGVNTYYCVPHRGLGMKGGVAVGDDVPTVGGDGADGATGPALPGGDTGGLFMLLLFATGALGALFVFGADAYQSVREEIRGPEEGMGTLAESEEAEPANPLGHDDYDPRGTLRLILIYFAILLVMWVFVYFVEFLGRGPTVIG